MNPNPHKIRCWWCDVKRAWQRIRHGKAARWTVAVHLIYYIHATIGTHGWHFATTSACAIALLFELLTKED